MKLLATLSLLAIAATATAGNIQDQDFGYNSQYNDWDDFYLVENDPDSKTANILGSQPSVGDDNVDQRLNEVFNSYD